MNFSERSRLWLLILSCLLFSWMSSSFCSLPSAGADWLALWRCSSGRSLTWMSWMCRREGIPPNTMWVVSLSCLHFCKHVFGKAPQVLVSGSDLRKWKYFHLIHSLTFAFGLCWTWHHLWWSSGCIQQLPTAGKFSLRDFLRPVWVYDVIVNVIGAECLFVLGCHQLVGWSWG